MESPESKSNINENILDPQDLPMSDTEKVLFLCQHIDKPCEVEIESGKIDNIRYTWISLAKKSIEVIKNEELKRVLENKIKEYEK